LTVAFVLTNYSPDVRFMALKLLTHHNLLRSKAVAIDNDQRDTLPSSA
jgi:hypothetical protein